MIYSFFMGVLSTIGFLVVLWVIFYTAGNGWGLGIERAKRKSIKEQQAKEHLDD